MENVNPFIELRLPAEQCRTEKDVKLAWCARVKRERFDISGENRGEVQVRVQAARRALLPDAPDGLTLAKRVALRLGECRGVLEDGSYVRVLADTVMGRVVAFDGIHFTVRADDSTEQRLNRDEIEPAEEPMHVDLDEGGVEHHPQGGWVEHEAEPFDAVTYLESLIVQGAMLMVELRGWTIKGSRVENERVLRVDFEAEEARCYLHFEWKRARVKPKDYDQLVQHISKNCDHVREGDHVIVVCTGSLESAQRWLAGAQGAQELQLKGPDAKITKLCGRFAPHGSVDDRFDKKVWNLCGYNTRPRLQLIPGLFFLVHRDIRSLYDAASLRDARPWELARLPVVSPSSVHCVVLGGTFGKVLSVSGLADRVLRERASDRL